METENHSSIGSRNRKVLFSSWHLANKHHYRPTWVEIDTVAFKNNLKKIKKHLKSKTMIMAVVKANAYGHAAVVLAKIALKNGASLLGVATIEEGIELRKAGIKSEILLLGSTFPLENFFVAAKYKLTPTISSLKGLMALEETGVKLSKKIFFHLKVDSGMGRVGVSQKGSQKLLEAAVKCKYAKLTGIYTHFSVAGTDKKFSNHQLAIFNDVVNRAKKLGLRFIAHAANSSAILKLAHTHFDLVRPGIMLYGMYPFHGARKIIDLEPVLSWKTRVSFLKKLPAGASISYSRTFITKKPSIIATVPVGYADGYDRRFSNKAEVLVRGKRCKVVGRVTMDMIMVDVTGVSGVSIGDEVVLIGSQGNEKIRVEELANIARTINYEITCSISYRVPRIIF